MQQDNKYANGQKVCQFITKLIDMMEKFPQNIFWADKDDEIIFFNLRHVENYVLPGYFRHSNFSSFIRQLNMYGFCKKEKTQDFLRFKHKIFKKGNQSNYYTIKRKSKQKKQCETIENPQVDYKQLISQIHQQVNLTQKQKQFISQLLLQKKRYESCIKQIKQNIGILVQQSRGFETIEIKSLINQIEQQFNQKIQGVIEKSNNVDEILLGEVSFESQKNILQSSNKYTGEQQQSVYSQCSFENNLKDVLYPKIGYYQVLFNENQEKVDPMQMDCKLRFNSHELSDHSWFSQ